MSVNHRIMQLSALTGDGIDRFWAMVSEFRQIQQGNGALAARRKHQALAWMWERIEAGLHRDFRQHPAVQQLLPELMREVEEGKLPASTAARQLLQARTTENN